MSNINYDYINEYIDSFFYEEDIFLIKLREYAVLNKIPIIKKQTEQFLKFLLNFKNPKNILEIGTAIGFSSIFFAKTIKNIEHIDTIEKNINMVSIAKENIKLANLENIINVIQGDAQCILETKINQKYDLIFIDAAKGQYKYYFDLAFKYLNESGIIICDNILYQGMVASRNLLIRRKITIVKRLQKFSNEIMKNENLISSIIPIDDGIMLIERKKY